MAESDNHYRYRNWENKEEMYIVMKYMFVEMIDYEIFPRTSLCVYVCVRHMSLRRKLTFNSDTDIITSSSLNESISDSASTCVCPSIMVG